MRTCRTTPDGAEVLPVLSGEGQHNVAALRLLQIADSAFPVGGFAYSHGLEWLVHEGAVRDEAHASAFVVTFVDQVLGGQVLPAALAVMRARSEGDLLRADDELDASFGTATEREAGRTMGERLLVAAAGAFPGPTATAMAAAVHGGRTPGQYATAFAAVTRDQGADERAALLGLASTMLVSVSQAAIRLGVLGQDGATRLIAGAGGHAGRVAERLLAGQRIPRPGAFVPGIDLAGALHPTLSFRMFAS